jgi:hypothetical protein
MPQVNAIEAADGGDVVARSGAARIQFPEQAHQVRAERR